MSQPKQYIPPEIMRLMQLGRDGKLWALEVVYSIRDKNEYKQMIKRNLTEEELLKTREAMFKYGLQIPVEPGHWKIICPIDILEVDLYKQKAYVMEPHG